MQVTNDIMIHTCVISSVNATR